MIGTRVRGDVSRGRREGGDERSRLFRSWDGWRDDFYREDFFAAWDWCMIAIGSLRSRKFKNLLRVVKDEDEEEGGWMKYVKIIGNYLNFQYFIFIK